MEVVEDASRDSAELLGLMAQYGQQREVWRKSDRLVWLYFLWVQRNYHDLAEPQEPQK